MDRRRYLQSAAAIGAVAAAGCLDEFDSLPGTDADDEGREHAEGAVLGPPEQDLSGAIHPSYGEESPSFSVEDPLAGETITDDQFRGERAYLMTFVYTSCPDDVCPALLQYLRFAQQDAAEEGYADDVAFLAITFDPETDDADALEAEGTEIGADLDAGNWHFLRPESNEAANDLVAETFGVPLPGLDGDHEGHGDDEGDHGDHGEDNTSGDDENASGDDEESSGVHYDLVLLVNEDGIVERSYPSAYSRASAEQIIEDLRTVAEGEDATS